MESNSSGSRTLTSVPGRSVIHPAETSMLLTGGRNTGPLWVSSCVRMVTQSQCSRNMDSVCLRFLHWTHCIAMRASLLALGCCACLGTYQLPPEPGRGDLNAKPTTETREYVTRGAWQQSGFYRTGDEAISLPVFIAIANDGTACLIPTDVWAVWRYGRMVECKSWRIARAW